MSLDHAPRVHIFGALAEMPYAQRRRRIFADPNSRVLAISDARRFNLAR